MKSIFILSAFCILFVACSGNDATSTQPVTGNKVLLLKVDYQTYTFEGGKELEFDAAETFTVDVNYEPPGDFGNVSLYYSETEQMLFDGSIVWSGIGEMNYPENLMAPGMFEQTDNVVPMPDDQLELISYGQGEPGLGADNTAIWSAVNKLQKVKDYRASNPGASVKLFLYTPSVGVGNPVDWDWFLFIKN